MSDVIIGDIETNAIHQPSKIHMVGIVDFYTDEYTSYHGETLEDGLIRLAEAELVIGHNFRLYDAANIARMTGGLVTIEPTRIIDTLDLSRALVPELPDHKLRTWGQALGFPKLDHDDFERYTPLMDEYCQRDCRLNKRIFEFMLENFPDRILPVLEGKCR